MSVVALCEEVTRLLGPSEIEGWRLEEMAGMLAMEVQRRGSTVPIVRLLSLSVAAVLELSRERENSTERLTTESTCESTCASVELRLSREEVDYIAHRRRYQAEWARANRAKKRGEDAPEPKES